MPPIDGDEKTFLRTLINSNSGALSVLTFDVESHANSNRCQAPEYQDFIPEELFVVLANVNRLVPQKHRVTSTQASSGGSVVKFK